MNSIVEKLEPDGQKLCIACGLCCTGHIFPSAVLKNEEIEKTRSLGMNVTTFASGEADFYLPCLHWKEKCTIYQNPDKPYVCGKYECLLLKKLIAETITLAQALAKVNQAQEIIKELESLLPGEHTPGFRARLVAQIKERENSNPADEAETLLRMKGGVLLVFFGKQFGISALFENPVMSPTENSEKEKKNTSVQ
jgi:hypothetical protein